jgi:formylglycine-generating enzyme required for sulfatase activity
VGLNESSEGTPKEKSGKIAGVYPWGTQWPPPSGAGNYCGEETKSKNPLWPVITGYNDGYTETSPVGSFNANKYGLYDMGGNVGQLCEDWYVSDQKYQVLRGASWIHCDPDRLLSSYRDGNDPRRRDVSSGFRCVVVVSPSTATSPASAPGAAPATAAEKPKVPVAGKPWTNSLGVKFVPAGTDGVLFSVWDVRVKDYAVFVKEIGHDWPKADFTQTENDPAVMVSWDDAHAFCDWLTKKEQAEGRLASNQKYRLPTDAEWSKAVGLKESSGGTPVDKDGKITGVYPWGTQWPPPRGAGNYNESLTHDGYANASPVGSFAANSYGLYDMGGNVVQWCEDKYDNEHDYRVLRGASWGLVDPAWLLSSCRFYLVPGDRDDYHGFRVVVVVSP